MVLPDKICRGCDIVFTPKLERAVFHSKDCGNAFRYRQTYVPKPRTGSEERKCAYKNCTNMVHYFPRDIKYGRIRFCSKECSAFRQMTNEERICDVCERTYYCSKSQVHYRGRVTCSKRCAGIKRTRDAERRNRENPPSQGVLNRRIRYSKKMQDWRKAVFERDNYTCQMCGKRGGYLQADHIKPFALFPELRTVLSNGRTLCKPCHLKTDTFGSKTKLIQKIIEKSS